mmetsp:Transcript_38461/g.78819  ORF Transcript_38461/g.78819 Transcript_38461/m.78819 type:complete len:314 (-) Transcript_38461:267-1208(-)|eukprot:CAMPEP_0181323968 /NCGR_PEP_ID=MMETSP1101-20121128/20086_1 /TAXON_ID=46948 /ORGANISM="Rhodomonas abbreviata, Strain Caron Lab Isolate" /LENGTH=313 /DNA_ID=CAMNT_0023432067 /DNA_START=182 /DNA_END=1123 /DNA_ORIENTATION=-
MTVEKNLVASNPEDQRARLVTWVKNKCSQSKPQVAKAMRTFVKQLSNDLSADEIPEGRLLSALERETLIRAQKLQIVSDLESVFPAPTKSDATGPLLAEWTEKEWISARELSMLRKDALASKLADESAEGNEEGFCLDMNGREFPPVTGLVDDEKWVQVDEDEKESSDDDELQVSFMDDDDDWVLAVMLQLETCKVENENDGLPKLNFRRAVVDGAPRPVSQDSTSTDESSEDIDEGDSAGQDLDIQERTDASASRGGDVLCRSELADDRQDVKRDIGAWKKSRSVSEARRILQQTEKRNKQKKGGGGKRNKH